MVDFGQRQPYSFSVTVIDRHVSIGLEAVETNRVVVFLCVIVRLYDFDVCWGDLKKISAGSVFGVHCSQLLRSGWAGWEIHLTSSVIPQ
jgi:hypothetical protein